MRVSSVPYSTFITLAIAKSLYIQYIEKDNAYEIFATEDNINWETYVPKDGGANQINFETNYKVAANKPIGARGSQVATRSDTYTTTGTGQIVSNILGFSRYALQVQVTGAGIVPTSWSVFLEGSLDGVNFSTIFTSTDAIKQGVIWGGAIDAPALYIRSNCAALVLGSATNIVATILGQE
jgi:hypothetical protein